MRKVTYHIDDALWLRTDFEKCYPDLPKEKIEEIMGELGEPFRAVYSLIGDKQPDRYELTVDGEKCSINDKRINNYQRGCILNDCYRHYTRAKRGEHDILAGYPDDVVFGAIEIEETEVDG